MPRGLRQAIRFSRCLLSGVIQHQPSPSLLQRHSYPRPFRIVSPDSLCLTAPRMFRLIVRNVIVMVEDGAGDADLVVARRGRSGSRRAHVHFLGVCIGQDGARRRSLRAIRVSSRLLRCLIRGT